MLELNIIKTEKVGIDAHEHFIVEYEGVVYLRAISNGHDFIAMTATASEDDKVIKAYKNQEKLISTAIEIAKSYKNCPANYAPEVKLDCCGRGYIELFSFSYHSDLYRFADKLLTQLLKSDDPSKYVELLFTA